jgi:hypothetical protein
MVGKLVCVMRKVSFVDLRESLFFSVSPGVADLKFTSANFWDSFFNGVQKTYVPTKKPLVTL